VQVDFAADLSGSVSCPCARFGGEEAKMQSFVPGDTAMKAAMFMFGVISLSVLIGVATPAGAAPFNAKVFFEQQQRWGGGGGGGGM
jgi:hypothetical protein